MMKRSSPLLWCVAPFIIAAIVTVWAGSADASRDDAVVKIIETRGDGLVFEYQPGTPSFRGRRLYLPGTVRLQEIGKPELPIRRVHVGVPLEGSVEAELIEVQWGAEVEADIPIVVPAGSGPRAAERETPMPPMVTDEPTFLRNQRVFSVTLFPVRYEPARGRAVIARRIVVDVRFAVEGEGCAPAEPDDPFESIYRRTLLNYDQARSWRRCSEAEAYPARGMWTQGERYKVVVTEPGLYALTYNDLAAAGLPVEMIDPQTFKVHSWGGRVLPTSLTDPRPDSVEVPIKVNGEEDEAFDPGDYLLFYGVGVADWEFDSLSSQYLYYGNPYTDENVYWLSWGGVQGARVPQRYGAPVNPGAVDISRFTDRIRLEEERINLYERSGLEWIWEELTRGSTESSVSTYYTVNLEGVTSGDTVLIRAGLLSASSGDPHRIRLYLNDHLAGEAVWGSGQVNIAGEGPWLEEGQNTIEIEHYRGPDDETSSTVRLDYFELEYRRAFVAAGGGLRFGSPIAPTGIYRFTVRGIGTDAEVWDITDPLSPVEITGFAAGSDSLTFDDGPSEPSQYLAVDGSGLRSPERIEADSPSDLRHPVAGADYIVISHEDFLSAAQALVDWREDHLARVTAPRAMLIDAQDVYDEFAGGLLDPTAIRDFLRHAVRSGEWSPAPAYCLFLGTASYDFKNNLGLTISLNFIPTYESQTIAYDDWFAYFDGNDRFPDIHLGRFAVRSESEAASWIAKTLAYEGSPELGAWRNRVLLIADDEFSEFSNLETVHVRDTEDLSHNHIPDLYDQVKVYLMEYPRDSGGQKPEAREDIIRGINRGVGVVSYIGHGNSSVLAHERVLRHPVDIDRFANRPMWYIMMVASCSVGQFDDPLLESMAGYMSRIDDGAVVCFAASRPTQSTPNAELTDTTLAALLADSLLTVGECLTSGKMANFWTTNRYYLIFGDPAIAYRRPETPMTVLLDSLTTVVGDSVVTRDSLIAGELLSLEGTVTLGGAPVDGMAFVVVSGAIDTVDHQIPNGSTVRYLLPGDELFRGTSQVVGGQLRAEFVVPEGIDSGQRGRVTAYLWDGLSEGRGLIDSLSVRGSGAAPTSDTLGPSIRLFASGKPIVDGDYVPEDLTLEAVIADPSGINISGITGHQIRIIINNDPANWLDVTDYFVYDQGSYQSGRFTYPLTLPAGEDTIEVTASDSHLNRTSVSTVVRVVEDIDLRIDHVVNYPNPFPNDTHFTFQLTRDADVEIRIFTVSGRLIRKVTGIAGEAGYNQVWWNGRDEDGDRLANGVYIYKIIARASRSGAGLSGSVILEASAIGRLAVLR